MNQMVLLSQSEINYLWRLCDDDRIGIVDPEEKHMAETVRKKLHYYADKGKLGIPIAEEDSSFWS